MVEDFTPKYDNYAVYLPSLQKGYAQFAAKNQRLLDKGTVPANLNIKDLNYLSTDSTLWQCRYALYSAGQFNGSIIEQADMVRDRNKDNTVVVGDSGGYQIATGKLNALNGWADYKNKPKVIFDKWMAETSVRDRLVRWLDCYCDYAVTIDMPLWITTKRNGIFAKLDTKQLIDLSVENLKFVAKRRGAATGAKAKYLNVLHDVGNGTGDAWYDAVKDFDFEGWSFGSDTGKDVDAILHWLRRLLDDKKLDKAEWLHILQASPPKNGKRPV